MRYIDLHVLYLTYITTFLLCFSIKCHILIFPVCIFITHKYNSSAESISAVWMSRVGTMRICNMETHLLRINICMQRDMKAIYKVFWRERI